jgi:predicted DNA-binding protein (MmcQ/YjbR family)
VAASEKTQRPSRNAASEHAHDHDHPHEHAPMSKATLRTLERVRRLCLALPEGTEKETWGEATFRVREKIFLMAGGSDRLQITMKAPPGAQEVLVAGDPAHCYVPAYVGHRGWVGVRIDNATAWKLIAELIEESYRMTAPRRLAATIGAK